MRASMLAALGAALVLMGCSSGLPKESLFGRETATLTFAKGYIGQTRFGKAAKTEFSFYADKDCSISGRVPFDGLTANERVEIVPAGKVFFRADAAFIYLGGLTKRCSLQAGFTARPGGHYSVMVRTSEVGCTFEILDVATATPPADVDYSNDPYACRNFMRRPPAALVPVPRPPAPPLAESGRT